MPEQATSLKKGLSPQQKAKAILNSKNLLITSYSFMKSTYEKIYDNTGCIKSYMKSFDSVLPLYINTVPSPNNTQVVVVSAQSVDPLLITMGEKCSIQRAEFENPLKKSLYGNVLPYMWEAFKKVISNGWENQVIKDCENSSSKKDIAPCTKDFMDYTWYIYKEHQKATKLSSALVEKQGANVKVLFISQQGGNLLIASSGASSIAISPDPQALQAYQQSNLISTALQITSGNDESLTPAISCKATYPLQSDDYDKCMLIAHANGKGSSGVVVVQECKIGRSDDSSVVCAEGVFTGGAQVESLQINDVTQRDNGDDSYDAANGSNARSSENKEGIYHERNVDSGCEAISISEHGKVELSYKDIVELYVNGIEDWF